MKLLRRICFNKTTNFKNTIDKIIITYIHYNITRAAVSSVQ